MTYKMGIKISQKFMISGLVCKMQIFFVSVMTINGN